MRTRSLLAASCLITATAAGAAQAVTHRSAELRGTNAPTAAAARHTVTGPAAQEDIRRAGALWAEARDRTRPVSDRMAAAVAARRIQALAVLAGRGVATLSLSDGSGDVRTISDLDGDKRADVLDVHDDKAQGMVLVARSGATGHALWTKALGQGFVMVVPPASGQRASLLVEQDTFADGGTDPVTGSGVEDVTTTYTQLDSAGHSMWTTSRSGRFIITPTTFEVVQVSFLLDVGRYGTGGARMLALASDTFHDDGVTSDERDDLELVSTGTKGGLSTSMGSASSADGFVAISPIGAVDPAGPDCLAISQAVVAATVFELQCGTAARSFRVVEQISSAFGVPAGDVNGDHVRDIGLMSPFGPGGVLDGLPLPLPVGPPTLVRQPGGLLLDGHTGATLVAVADDAFPLAADVDHDGKADLERVGFPSDPSVVGFTIEVRRATGQLIYRKTYGLQSSGGGFGFGKLSTGTDIDGDGIPDASLSIFVGKTSLQGTAFGKNGAFLREPKGTRVCPSLRGKGCDWALLETKGSRLTTTFFDGRNGKQLVRRAGKSVKGVSSLSPITVAQLTGSAGADVLFGSEQSGGAFGVLDLANGKIAWLIKGASSAEPPVKVITGVG